MGVPQIFDRHAYALHRARQGTSFLLEDVGESLAYRLRAVNRRFVWGLDLNSREDVHRFLVPCAERWTRTALAQDGQADVVADEEFLPFADESFDLIASALSLHTVNDLPGALVQIRRALKPDGLFVAAIFGGATLFELRQAWAQGECEILGGASPRVSPFADVRELGALLHRAGFALPVADSEKTVVRYREFATLVSDLRAMGETNALAKRSKTFLRRDVLASALSAYGAENSDPEGRLAATFEVIYLSGWAPHESQQQPLRPGSAQVRLADALGTREFSAGEAVPRKPEGA